MNIDPQYTTKFKGQTWAKVRDTEARNGHYIPVSGYRTFNKKDRFVPRGSNTLKGEEFDEARGLACSDVGVLASTIKEDKSYFIFGFQGYIKISRPCPFCEKANNKV